MQVASRGLAKLRSRPIAIARALSTSGELDGGLGKAMGVITSDVKVTSGSTVQQPSWRSPTPLFGGPGLLGGSGVSPIPQSAKRGFKSSKCNHNHADGSTCNHDHSKDSSVPKGEDDSEFVWEQKSIDFLLDNNKKWVDSKTKEDPDFFKRLASVHKPEFLFIGCSDARLSVQHMLGCEAGELFVHRNVANQVMHNDLNLLTVLTYAVDYLKVKHIIVCGHYDCGGVRAAMKNHDHGLIENWIMSVKDVARLHSKELKELSDDEAIHRRLVELNVQEQCMKLYSNPVVQKSQAKEGGPHVHALVFDVGEGLVKELDFDFKSIIRKYSDVYNMYKFE